MRSWMRRCRARLERKNSESGQFLECHHVFSAALEVYSMPLSSISERDYRASNGRAGLVAHIARAFTRCGGKHATTKRPGVQPKPSF